MAILKHPIYKRLALKVYRSSEAILCVSNFLANNIGKATGNSNMLIIPNIIDSDLFCYATKLPTVEQAHIACCATWNSPKRLDLIVRSLLQFAPKTNKNFTLYVIGNGVQLEEFKTIDCPRNLIIQWLGHVKKHEITNILVKSDFFMHASEIETFSIVIAEALSTGTPVLASNVGAIPELINSSNGILVDNTLEGWLKGLHEITKRQYDHEAIAASVAEKYSPASIGQKIDEVYKHILQS
jgi:L-malate glycosyltransferase